MGDPYIFDSGDHDVVKTTLEMLTKICASNLVKESEKKQIRSLMKLLSDMPEKSYDGTDAMVILKGPKRCFGDRTISHSWVVEARDGEVSVNAAGYFSRPSTGGDSFTSFIWQAYPNCDTDSCDYSATLGLVDDAQSFRDEVAEIDLAEPGFSVSVVCEHLPRFSSKRNTAKTVSKKKLQKQFNPDELTDEVARDAQLVSDTLFRGYACLAFLKEEKQKLSFDVWKEQLQAASSGDDVLMSGADLLWLWYALKNCTKVKANIGNLATLSSNKAKRDKRFQCLPADARFAIGFKPKQVKQLLADWPLQESTLQAAVRTLEPLELKNGKAGRLDCCDVQCEVTLKVDVAHTADKEADIMRIDAGDIEVIDSLTVRAKVRSLNQAYTVASRRLEPDRRSHGGRVYDHFVYFKPDSPTALLEEIRCGVEQGRWDTPDSASDNDTGRSL